MMIGTVVLGGIAAALIVFGSQIGSTISNHIGVSGIAFTVIWTIVRCVLAIIFVSLLFSFYYYLGPKRESPKWHWISPGGLVGTLIFLAASLGFYMRSRKTAVNPNNVNAEWTGKVAPGAAGLAAQPA